VLFGAGDLEARDDVELDRPAPTLEEDALSRLVTGVRRRRPAISTSIQLAEWAWTRAVRPPTSKLPSRRAAYVTASSSSP